MRLTRLLLVLTICVIGIQAAQPLTYVMMGSDVQGAVALRLEQLIRAGSQYDIQFLSPTAAVNYTSLRPGSCLLSFGNTTQTNALIQENEQYALEPEAYIVRSALNSGIFTIVTTGKSQINLNPFVVYRNIGLYYGCYELLKQLGYGFLHPLQPVIPAPFKVSSSLVDIKSAPVWPIRGWHYHTMHPLDLCEFFNGMDSNTTKWEDMVPELGLYAEWLVANRQNRLEYLLLWTRDWDEFAWGSLRQSRLKKINGILHEWGIASGGDVPLAEKQQHAWFMTGSHISTEEQQKNISKHIDWLMESDFDFLSTESGFSEFTHPDCSLMLSWMDFATDYITNHFVGKRIYIKCHCSTGQVCPDYLNPNTGEPLNFNFLPAYASPDLGIYPHTVQIYTLDQPAPTYGNQNFTYMLEFLVQETGKREVVFHPESAYWVNYDINVPLFLPPVYGANRITDMRIVHDASQPAGQAQGQMNFESGWDWAYWLGNSMTAYAAWDPKLLSKEEDAIYNIMHDVLASLAPPSGVDKLTKVLQEIADMENRLLVYGNWNGTAPSNVVYRNGQAYLAGWDTWSEWVGFLHPGSLTQPLRLTFQQMRSKVLAHRQPGLPNYEREIEPLLNAMQLNFTSALETLSLLRSEMYPWGLPFFDELVDTMNITKLRAIQVHSLYQYVWGEVHRKSADWRQAQIEIANSAMSEAQEVVARRESQFRVPLERIASWRKNPTAYPYTYLWTAHSLFYFWRDYSVATTVNSETKNPCFMNIINPVDIGFGPGPLLNISAAIADWMEANGMEGLAECLTTPVQEPVYPLTPIIVNVTALAREDHSENDSIFIELLDWLNQH